MPFSQVLGAKKKSLAGMSTATAQVHQGFIVQCPIIQQTPPALKLKAMRLVASKCTLLARVDAFGQDPLVGSRRAIYVPSLDRYREHISGLAARSCDFV
jgi:U4/U6 small nuclear ribonucleoprotein PRP31